MPTISMFYGILIQMFWNDHAPPHFHALYAEYEVLIDIHTLEVIRGSMPRRALALVLEWAFQHRKELIEDWELCEQNQSPKENISPRIVCTAPWRLTKVTPLANYELKVEFNDGAHGIVEMVKLIMSDHAGVFAALKDLDLFNKAHLEFGVITWPGEIDLAPDAMHNAIKQKGRWILQ